MSAVSCFGVRPYCLAILTIRIIVIILNSALRDPWSLRLMLISVDRLDSLVRTHVLRRSLTNPTANYLSQRLCESVN